MDNGQGKTEKIEIPKIVYQGDDKKLKERIFKFKSGSLRIAVFTVVGLIMGAFSHTYTKDSFLLTKAILAIPYKICEAIYLSVIGTTPDPIWQLDVFFFPRSWPAGFIAENVTTVLIGGAIYGSLAYFTGDKRVFTLQRFLKFAGCWCAVILLTIGAAYGINAKAMADNDRLLGEPEFFLHHGKLETGSLGGGRIIGSKRSQVLRELLYDGLEPAQVQRDGINEVWMELQWPFRVGYYRVNCKECYLATEQGTTYRISEEFAEVIRIYYDTGELPEEIEALFSDGEAGLPGEEAEVR